MTKPMNSAIDGDPVDQHQADDLRNDLRIEIDRIVAFVGKIESSLRETNSAEHARWLDAQHARQMAELRRLDRMTRALDTRFGLEASS